MNVGLSPRSLRGHFIYPDGLTVEKNSSPFPRKPPSCCHCLPSLRLPCVMTEWWLQWMSQQAGLPAQHLSGTISRLKAFNAKRKWRAVASVVMLGAKFGLKKRGRADSNEGPKAYHDCELFNCYLSRGPLDCFLKWGVP